MTLDSQGFRVSEAVAVPVDDGGLRMVPEKIVQPLLEQFASEAGFSLTALNASTTESSNGWSVGKGGAFRIGIRTILRDPFFVPTELIITVGGGEAATQMTRDGAVGKGEEDGPIKRPPTTGAEGSIVRRGPLQLSSRDSSSRPAPLEAQATGSSPAAVHGTNQPRQTIGAIPLIPASENRPVVLAAGSFATWELAGLSAGVILLAYGVLRIAKVARSGGAAEGEFVSNGDI
ncbi:MAG: hypothetical protein AB1679_19380 [Actinomycetota bacterium]